MKSLVNSINEGSFSLKMFKANELPNTVEYEEGTLIINNYITGFGSGKKTVVSGWFKDQTYQYLIENCDIQRLKNKLLKWCGAAPLKSTTSTTAKKDSDFRKLSNMRKELAEFAYSVDFNPSNMEELKKCYIILYKLLCNKDLAERKASNNARLLALASEKMQGVDKSLLTEEQQEAYNILFGAR